MLDEKDICDVITLCDAFRMKAKELRDARLAEKKDVLHGGRLTSAAEHAALLRCSMDLTRALANMRRRK